MKINIRKILASDKNEYIKMSSSFYNTSAVMHKIPSRKYF